MARTQAVDFDQRREAIAAAAAELIAKNGFLGASLIDIAASCNMSKSQLYHYFPAKEDILFAIIWRHVSNLVHLAKSIAARDLVADEQLRWLARIFMEAYSVARAPHIILLNETGNLPPENRSVIYQAERDVIEVADKFVVRQSFTLRNQPKQRLPYVMMFFSMINWAHTWFDRAGPVSEHKVADIATDMFLKGLPH